MRYLDEEPYIATLHEEGIVPCDDGRSLCYDTGDYYGFDFTNLTSPQKGADGLLEPAGEGRHVERAMIETLLTLLVDLGQAPLRLIPLDDDWADDELESLIGHGYLTKDEGAVLSRVVADGKAMDVIEIAADEIATGVALLLPQLTVRSTVCAIVGGEGETLSLISQDDEISFNTDDRGVYDKARALMKQREIKLPFEVVWVD
ncbi:MAG: hypothetical protein HQK87_01785 [Nitrospinae bacterium]|nr:hypothetical protein [Nitrospinota bacterium]